jgi:hypothetical protein
MKTTRHRTNFRERAERNDQEIFGQNFFTNVIERSGSVIDFVTQKMKGSA